MSKKKKVAILGGGPGGLSAAHFLAESGADLDITIYTMGWRIGGKGASGRNYDMADRIEEHGIHLFGNFYPNALHMIRDCYDSVDEFEAQFLPMNLQLLTEYYDGQWRRYPARFAKSGKQPWETDQIIEPLDKLTEKTIANIYQIFHTKDLADQKGPPPDRPHWLGRLFAPLVRRALKNTFPHGDAHIDKEHQNDNYKHGHTWSSDIASKLLRFVMGIMHRIARHHARTRYIYTQLDHLIGCIHGYMAFDLEHKGIGSISEWNHLRWLKYVGVSEMTLASPVVKAIPNVCFQFPWGDTTGKPNMAASAYMTYILRQLLASGDSIFFFKEGTGETAIKPLYDKLVERGVKIKFFHKVRDVVPSDTEDRIERIDIEVQAEPEGDYQPIDEKIINGKKVRVWPATTPWQKLKQGERYKDVNLESWWGQIPGENISLKYGEDFDYAVMAIPVGAHPFVCPSLMDDSKKDDVNHDQKAAWRSMYENVHTIPTQAFQLWLKEPISDLGLRDELLRPGERWAGPTYNNPTSGWTDFSDLIELEGWQDKKPEEDAPKTLIYFCGALQELEGGIPLDDPDYPGRQYERVKATIVQELSHINGLLENATREDDHQQMRFELLESVDPKHNDTFQGEQRIWCQHIRVNIDPNERYTVSPPGQEKHLRHSWESGYSNLAMAGDWIFTGFNIGSFEGSVMSGKLASYALTGSPNQDQIYGFNFLRVPPEPGNVPMIR